MNKKLSLFHERVGKLRENSDFFTNMRVGIGYKKGEGIKTTFTGPDPKTIKAFILDFRPFVLNDEPVNFDYISNIAYQLAVDVKTKENVVKAKKTWSDLLERKKEIPVGGLRLEIDGKKILSQENLNIWINGDYAHLDSDKRQTLSQIRANPMGEISQFVFVDLLQRLSALLF